MEEKFKICSKCKEQKKIVDFYSRHSMCKICHHKLNLDRWRNYRLINKEKLKEKRKIKYAANSYVEKDRAHKYIFELNSGYIRKLIIGHNNILKKNDIPQELIELKRVQLMITRELKKVEENESIKR
jgi:hypothetical protein